MTPAEMEAIIAELEAGLKAELKCEGCSGAGEINDEDNIPFRCWVCGGTGIDYGTLEGERAFVGIWAREKRRAVEALGCEVVEARG